MKLICYGDYQLPVPDNANWIAWDKHGQCNWYFDEPEYDPDCIHEDLDLLYNNYLKCGGPVSMYAEPPEPGHWRDQIYYLEDQ